MWKYTPNFIPNKIVVWGCGGTGSRLVPLVAQFVKTCNWVIDPKMILVDDDIIEEKNLLRQNFVSQDVGKSKAITLAQRYSKAFNLDITPVVERLTESFSNSEINKLIYNLGTQNYIHIICVDSPESRRSILKFIGRTTNDKVLIIDTGNENDFGQVSVSTGFVPMSNSYVDKLPNDIPFDISIPFIPIDLSYFTEMTEVSKVSCADLDQTMAINAMMAVTALGYIQNFYYAKPIFSHRTNVSLSHGSTPEYINSTFVSKCSKCSNTTRGVYGIDLKNLGRDVEEVYYKYEDFRIEMEKLEKKKLEPIKTVESTESVIPTAPVKKPTRKKVETSLDIENVVYSINENNGNVTITGFTSTAALP